MHQYTSEEQLNFHTKFVQAKIIFQWTSLELSIDSDILYVKYND